MIPSSVFGKSIGSLKMTKRLNQFLSPGLIIWTSMYFFFKFESAFVLTVCYMRRLVLNFTPYFAINVNLLIRFKLKFLIRNQSIFTYHNTSGNLEILLIERFSVVLLSRHGILCSVTGFFQNRLILTIYSFLVHFP